MDTELEEEVGSLGQGEGTMRGGEGRGGRRDGTRTVGVEDEN